VAANTIVFGLVGAALSVLEGWLTKRDVQKMLDAGLMKDPETGEDIHQLLVQNGWSFNIIG
jgi:hypothetical protein